VVIGSNGDCDIIGVRVKRYILSLLTALLLACCQAVAFGQAKLKAIGVQGSEVPAAHQKQKQSECYVFSRYVILTKETEDGVGEDIHIWLREPSSDPKRSCAGKSVNAYFTIKNDDSNFFFGLFGQYLFVDIGTGPEPRGLSVFDLSKKKKIYEASYNTPIKIGADGALDFWKPLEKDLPKKDCPQAKKWERQGLGYGFERRVIVDLKSLKERAVGLPRCTPRQ